jgi:tetrahydromethanopterin S-methyltransferase subunit B
LDLNLVGIND